MIRGMEAEAEAERKGWIGVFLTLTLPGAMHVLPKAWGCRWDGTLPDRGAVLLSRFWKRAGAMLSKSGTGRTGFWCKEPHRDGTPHMHALVFLPEEDLPRLLGILDFIWNWNGPGKWTRDAKGRRIWTNLAAEVRLEDKSLGRVSTYAFKHVWHLWGRGRRPPAGQGRRRAPRARPVLAAAVGIPPLRIHRARPLGHHLAPAALDGPGGTGGQRRRPGDGEGRRVGGLAGVQEGDPGGREGPSGHPSAVRPHQDPAWDPVP